MKSKNRIMSIVLSDVLSLSIFCGCENNTVVRKNTEISSSTFVADETTVTARAEITIVFSENTTVVTTEEKAKTTESVTEREPLTTFEELIPFTTDEN